MTFLAPLFFYLGLGVAGAALALHFIVTRQPPSSPLPTVRFVPQGSVRVTTIARPRHWWLLAARMVAAILAGAAFARPVLVPDSRPVARVVMADVSRDVASVDELRDSVQALLGAGDALIAFDTVARVVVAGAGVVGRSADDGSVSSSTSSAEGSNHPIALERSTVPARLSPALVTALRTATAMRERADSIELVLVSPMRAAAVDEATHPIRELWPGSIRVVRVAHADTDTARARTGIVLSGARAADALHAGASAAGLLGAPGSGETVRLARGAASAEDSAWAAGGRRTLVRWPADAAPPGWVARAVADTTGAVVAGSAAVVHRFARRHELAPTSMSGARVVARWVDGAPAAVERDAGDGCVRDVAIMVPEHGDLVLRPAFARLVRALAAPCARAAGGAALDSTLLASIIGADLDAGSAVPRDAIAAPDTIATPLVPWLVAATLVLLLVELLLRRRGARRDASVDEAAGMPEPEGARRATA